MKAIKHYSKDFRSFHFKHSANGNKTILYSVVMKLLFRIKSRVCLYRVFVFQTNQSSGELAVPM